MPLFAFRCGCGWTAELLKPRDTAAVTCTRCGQAAPRESVYRFGISGFASTPMGQQDMSRDYKRFDEASQHLAYQKERLEDSRQAKLPEPRLYSQAKWRAKRLERAGVTADQIKT